MALVTAPELRARFAPSMTSTDRDAELVLCIAAAQAWITAQPGGKTIEEPATAFVDYLDGNEAGGHSNHLLSFPLGRHALVKHVAPSDLVVVEENGVALVVADGYSTTADVLLTGANDLDIDRRPTLIRGNCAGQRAWATGVRNVKLTWKCGWTSGNVPAHVKQLIMEIAKQFATVGGVLGISSISKAEETVAIDKFLTPLSQQTLAMLTAH